MKKNNQSFICPYCHNDIREVGLLVKEIGSTTFSIQYNKEGQYKDEEIYDEETNDFVVCCGNCEERLDLQLRNAWDTLPEKISKFNEKD